MTQKHYILFECKGYTNLFMFEMPRSVSSIIIVTVLWKY